MTGDTYIAAGALLGACGVIALRIAWSRKERSLAMNTIAWALLGAGAVAGGLGAGAWGISITALCAMTAGFCLLAWAAARSPRMKKAASNRRAGMLPADGEPLRLTARVLTFLLVAGLAVLPSIGAGLALGMLGKAVGWSEANALAAAFFAVPLAWTLIAYAVLMQRGIRRQLRAFALASVATLPVLAGVVA